MGELFMKSPKAWNIAQQCGVGGVGGWVGGGGGLYMGGQWAYVGPLRSSTLCWAIVAKRIKKGGGRIVGFRSFGEMPKTLMPAALSPAVREYSFIVM